MKHVSMLWRLSSSEWLAQKHILTLQTLPNTPYIHHLASDKPKRDLLEKMTCIARVADLLLSQYLYFNNKTLHGVQCLEDIRFWRRTHTWWGILVTRLESDHKQTNSHHRTRYRLPIIKPTKCLIKPILQNDTRPHEAAFFHPEVSYNAPISQFWLRRRLSIQLASCTGTILRVLVLSRYESHCRRSASTNKLRNLPHHPLCSPRTQKTVLG